MTSDKISIYREKMKKIISCLYKHKKSSYIGKSCLVVKQSNKYRHCNNLLKSIFLTSPDKWLKGETNERKRY